MRRILLAVLLTVAVGSAVWLLCLAVLAVERERSAAQEPALPGGVPDAGPAPDAGGVECITREWCPSYRGCCRRGEKLLRQPCGEIRGCR